VNRIRTTLWICTAFLASIATVAVARTTWAYYDAAPGLSTAIVLTETGGSATEDAVQLRLYDDTGELISESVHHLASYRSTAVFVNDLLPESDKSMWGLVEIETDLRIQVGVWVGTGNGWLFVENYGEAYTPPPDITAGSYLYGLNYANTAGRRTTVTLLNPHDRLAFSTLWMHDANGVLQYHIQLPLAARRPVYVDLEEVYPVGKDVWGTIRVDVDRPILLVCGYFDADGYLIDVDVVDRPYGIGLRNPE